MRHFIVFGTRVFAVVVVVVVVVVGLAPVAGIARAEETPATAGVQAALTAALTVPDARVELISFERPAGDCAAGSPAARAEVPRPIDGSARVAVKLVGARPSGKACEVWGWARVRVFAPAAVTKRAIRAGDLLGPAIETKEREIKPGHVPVSIGDGATADHSLGAGLMLETDDVRAAGLRAGDPVKVVVVTGTLAVEQNGRAVPCARNHNCAVLPSGKHVDGTLVDGRLMVELQ